MKELFSIDGPLYRFCLFIYETFILNLLWVLGSLPILTIGVSSSALYYVYGKKVRGNSYSIYSDFVKGYKECFKKAFPFGAVITAVLFFSIFNLYKLNNMGSGYIWIKLLQVLIILQIMLISVFLFPLIARFNMGLYELIKNSVVLAYKHIIVSVCSIVMLTALIIFTLYKFSFALFIIGIYTYISSYFIEKVFNKYIKCEF